MYLPVIHNIYMFYGGFASVLKEKEKQDRKRKKNQWIFDGWHNLLQIQFIVLGHDNRLL